MDVSESTWDLAGSPFTSVVGTNYAPSAAEIASIKAFLVEQRRERSRLESKVRQLQALLEKSNKYIEAHEALMSPIRQLPSETLAEIFAWCLPTDMKYSVRDLKQAPLVFTAVCRSWRSICLGTPRLWNSIHIYLPPHLSNSAFSQREAGISLWLERSGALPLSISFHGRTSHISHAATDDSQIRENMGSLFRSLMRFSNRFANLSLSLSPRDFLYFDDLSPSQFPILTSLCLRDANLHEGIYGHLEDGPSEISFTSLLQRMPVLRKLQVKEFAFRSSFSRTLGVESLTSLDFTANAMGSFGVTVDVVQGLNLLSQMPRLRFLKAAIQLGVNADGENTPLPTIHLKHLEEMHMAFVRRSRPLLTGRMAAFFNHLKCPSLKTLGISWHGLLLSEVPFRGLPLHELETLALNVTMRWDTLLECLSLVPNLKSLQLRATEGRLENNPGHNLVHCALRDSHLSGLTFSAQNPLPLCPQLQKFQYLDKVLTSTDIVSTRVLTDFIESRQDTLKCCEMFFPVKPLFTEEELDRLKIVKQGGLELHLHSAKPFRTKRLDEPTVGLVSWLVHETPIQKVYEIVDMEGPYGTDVII